MSERDIELGRQAAVVLENQAFNTVLETIFRDLRKAFLGDSEADALRARDEAKALESVLTKLKRMQERAAHLERVRREAEEQADDLQDDAA